MKDINKCPHYVVGDKCIHCDFPRNEMEKKNIKYVTPETVE